MFSENNLLFILILCVSIIGLQKSFSLNYLTKLKGQITTSSKNKRSCIELLKTENAKIGSVPIVWMQIIIYGMIIVLTTSALFFQMETVVVVHSLIFINLNGTIYYFIHMLQLKIMCRQCMILHGLNVMNFGIVSIYQNVVI